MKVQTSPVGYRVSTMAHANVPSRPPRASVSVARASGEWSNEYQRNLARLAVKFLTNFYWYDVEAELLQRNIKCDAGDITPCVGSSGAWRYRARLCRRPGEMCRPITVTVLFGAGWHRPEITTVTLWVTSTGIIYPSTRRRMG
jgi:hypothetical protein